MLYDRPASAFAPIERAERERFRQALFARLGIRASTVGFIVCPTSWTEDEDFDVVIEAVHAPRGADSRLGSGQQPRGGSPSS